MNTSKNNLMDRSLYMNPDLKEIFLKELPLVLDGKSISIPRFQKTYNLSYDDASTLYYSLLKGWEEEKLLKKFSSFKSPKSILS